MHSLETKRLLIHAYPSFCFVVQNIRRVSCSDPRKRLGQNTQSRFALSLLVYILSTYAEDDIMIDAGMILFFRPVSQDVDENIKLEIILDHAVSAVIILLHIICRIRSHALAVEINLAHWR